MSNRRSPGDIVPRRSLEARREEIDEIEEFEDLTGEIAREGEAPEEGESTEHSRRRQLEEREEFEELTGEVTRENGGERG